MLNNLAARRALWKTLGLSMKDRGADTVPGQSEFRRLVAGLREDAAGLIESYGDHGDARRLMDEFTALLQNGHARAWAMGRRLAGDGTPFNDADEMFGIAATDDEARFLLGFLDDLEAGRYVDADGNLKANAIASRMKLYSHKLRGSANEAFTLASAPDELWDWVLGPNDHCPDCPEIAAIGPYTRDANLGFPGDGGTACITNCTCTWVRRSDGRSGFSRVD